MLPALILGFTLLARMSWYDPSLCVTQPINCYDPSHWWSMAAGHDAREWYNHALACPENFPLETIFHIEGSRYGLADGDWTCLDRGGSVKMTTKGAVLDLLRHSPVWGESLLVTVKFPLTDPPPKIVAMPANGY